MINNQQQCNYLGRVTAELLHSHYIHFEMSIFTKEILWTDSAKSIVIHLPLRGKQKKDFDVIQTKDYLKVYTVRNAGIKNTV